MKSRRSAAWLAAVSLAASALVAPSCIGSASIDLAKSLQVTDITTGWYDAGVVDGNMNKLVPSIAFRLKNGGDTIPGSVQLNAVFRRIGEGEEWGSAFVRAIDSDGLESGATSDPIVLRSTLGYTGSEPRNVILQHRLFVDAQVQLFAKYGSSQWTRLGDYKVQRVLLTH
jgi:hypothetical protein